MQDGVLVIILAELLVFLLWSMNRGRSDLRFRCWFLGWLLVLVHFISLLWHPAPGVSLLLRQAHIAYLEILAGLCFILSDAAIINSKQRLIRGAVFGTLPALFTVLLILFSPADRWALGFSLVATHSVTFFLVYKYAGKRLQRFVPLMTLCVLFAGWMLGALTVGRSELILASIPAEIFLINALLFLQNYPLKSPGNLATITGFILWACSSFFTIAWRENGSLDTLFPSIIYLPQFLVAIGMTLIVIEEDGAASRELAHEYEVLFNNNPNSLYIYDLRTLRFLSVNSASARMHGYSADEFRGKKLTDIVVGDALPEILDDIRTGQPRSNHRSLHARSDGTLIPLNVTSYNVRFRGRLARISLGEDQTEREQMLSQLIYQADHDLLTGLPNRHRLLQALDRAMTSITPAAPGCAVLILQIDRFEKINENYGHPVGDALLKQVTQLLSSALKPTDAIGRTGGREFTIVLAGILNGADAEGRAQNILELFADPLTIEEHSIEVAMNMGLAVFPEDSDDAVSLWRDAARAQARSRQLGVEGVVRLSRTHSLQAQEDSRIEAVMRRALQYGGFEVYYQPVLDANRKLCAFEALLRLREEDGTMVSPAVCIPIAESTGLIIPLGRWVLREVCRQLKTWQLNGLQVVPIAINVSALQIVLTNFCTDVDVALEEFDLKPSFIHFELTESSVMPRDSLALENMVKLATNGFSFSIDDFGTGFSSLDRLHKLPVSVLKIDRTFVSRMLDQNGTLPIVRTIISMAHALHLGVVAEGVETEEQLQMLAEMGCDQFQGFLFSRNNFV